MTTDETWQAHAARLAEMLEAHANQICASTSAQLVKTFPALCLDPTRADAARFQATTFRESPRRLHRLVVLMLRFGAPGVLEREYSWLVGLIPRYRVTPMHLQAMAGWYFNAARAVLPLTAPEYRALIDLKRTVLAIIVQAAQQG
jgi:hypothetical protein